MAAAFLAVLAFTRWRLSKHANMLRTGSDPHRIGLPKREGSEPIRQTTTDMIGNDNTP